MSIIVYIHIFLLWVYKYSANNTNTLPELGSDDRMQSLRILCPYNKFCGSSPLMKIEKQDHEPCCEECSCENDCFETGSCCPDMPLSGQAEPKFACKHLWDFGKNVDFTFPRTDSAYMYHIIDECPGKMIKLSYKKCYRPTEIQDYVIVYDNMTGNLYRNKHCAYCNGVEDFSDLKLRIDCNELIETDILNLVKSERKERKKYVLQKCTLTSLPPKGRIGMSQCLPETEIISACNVSGEWDIYDQKIVKGCMVHGKDQNMVYRLPITRTNKRIRYYANVFCFLCNVQVETEKTDSCKIPQLNEDEKSGFLTMYAILDITMWGDDVMTEETLCDSTEIWDPFSKFCRRMFCPTGHIPYHGNCKGLFSNINGYSIAIYFEVNIKNGTIVTGPILLNILKNRLLRELGKDLACGICRVTLLTKEITSSQLFFRQELFATDGCLYNTLLERVRQLAIKKKLYQQLRYRGQVISVEMILNFEDFETSFNILHESVSSFCYTLTVINASILLYCPTIMLTTDEVYTLGLNNESTSVSFHTIESGVMFQQVCVDSYFSAKQINSAPKAVYTFTLFNIIQLVCTTFCLSDLL